jgi:hypothetical protein
VLLARQVGLGELGGDLCAGYVGWYDAPVMSHETQVEHRVVQDLEDRRVLDDRAEVVGHAPVDLDHVRSVLRLQLDCADALVPPIQAARLDVEGDWA